MKLGLEFSRRPIRQRRMDSLVHVDFFKEIANVSIGFLEGSILVEIDLLFLEGTSFWMVYPKSNS